MLFRKLAFYARWQAHHMLCTSTRFHRTGISKDFKMSLHVADAPLTINSVRVPIGQSFARVGYADLGCSEGAVCLAVHGAPGSVGDILALAPSLTETGFRLVIPEFPGNILSET